MSEKKYRERTDMSEADVPLPTYAQAQLSNDSNQPLRLRITQQASSKHKRYHFEVSHASDAGGPATINNSQQYDIRFPDSDVTAFTINLRGSNSSSIICSVDEHQAFEFEVPTPDGVTTRFGLKDVKVPKFKSKDANALLEQTQQLNLDLVVNGECRSFIWRATPVQRSLDSELNTDAGAVGNGANLGSGEQRAIDLVLLDERYQQHAYFTNTSSSPVDKTPDPVLGILEIMTPSSNDTRFVEQVVITLLGLLELHIELGERSKEQRDGLAKNALLTALVCVVM